MSAIVISTLEKELEDVSNKFDATLAEVQTATNATAAEKQAAQQSLEDAVGVETRLRSELETAEKDHKDAASQLQTCEAAVKSFRSEMKTVATELAAGQKSLDQLQRGAVQYIAEFETFEGGNGQRKPKKSQYIQMDGIQYEADLLEIARSVAGNITQSVAEKIFNAALDGPGITPTEKRTLTYISKNWQFDQDAENWFKTKIGSSYYQVVDGKTYDRSLLQFAADVSKPITIESAQAIWEEAKDGPGITPAEMGTLERIWTIYPLTDEAREWVKSQRPAPDGVGV